MLFGEKVAMLASERGMKQKDICIAANVKKQTVSKIFQNQTTDPRMGTVIAIAEAFGMTPNELIEDVEFVKEPN